MIKKLMQFFKEEDGATAVEYALMVALIAMAIIIAVQTVGDNTNAVYESVGTTLGSAPVAPTP